MNLPNNIEAERKVLGACMRDVEALHVASEILGESAFYESKHQRIWEAMLSLNRKSIPIDITMLADELKSRGEQFVTGHEIAEISMCTTTSTNVEYHAGIVKKEADRRRIINLCASVEKAAAEGKENAESLVEQLTGQASHILDGRNRGPRLIGDFLDEHVVEWTQDCLRRSAAGETALGDVTTGIRELDDEFGGFNRGEMIILAARPSVGKTALAMDILKNVSIKKPALLLSLEMDCRVISRRAACNEAEIPLQYIRQGRLDQRDITSITNACARLYQCRLWVDFGRMSIAQICTKSRIVKEKEGKLGLIVIDYIQLIKGSSRNSRNEELGDISGELKGLAEQLQCPVLVLSQLNRDVLNHIGQGQVDYDKINACLRDSGAIEQDADMIMMMERHQQNDNRAVHITKQRNGKVGSFNIEFRSEIMKFVTRQEEKDPF